MESLFPMEEELPSIPGLSYRPEYVTKAEEETLVRQIDQQPWNTEWERRRQPYGAAYGQSDGTQKPIPDWGRRLAVRMQQDRISERVFDQMLVNEYLPGQGIALHFDYQSFDRTVVSLSLLSDCVMDFKNPITGERTSLLLERRSLIILSDDARYKWQHGIARRKTDRWNGQIIRRSRRLSVTFRLYKQR